MKQELMLSVIIISYKQEKYIKEAIDSVLNQKTNYKYEIILADDCSQDGTFEIMEEYAKKYPEIIKNLKREHNLGATQNELDASIHSRGKYITKLEGDDYWCDKNKIQKQVDFLEKNPEYIGITHPQQGRNMKNEVVGNFPVGLQEGDITLEEFCTSKKRYSYTSTIYRNIYKDKKHIDNIKYLMSLDRIVEDAQMCVYLLTLGKIKVIEKPMMVYRMRNEAGETNYNSTHSILEIQMAYLNVYLSLDEFFEYKYNFYNKFEKSVTLGFVYSLSKFKFKEAFAFIKKCPKKYKLKIILLLPINAIKIVCEKMKKK